MNIPNAIRVGGEIDAFCTRCELNLAHTIVAMVGPKVVKVQCNTCGADHRYRGVQPLEKRQSYAAPRSSAAPKAPRASARVIGWEEQFKGKDLTRAKRYSVHTTFAVDDVVDHPTFGLGLVRAVRGDKVDIAFKQQDRTLVHGKSPPPSADPQGS